VSAQAARPAVVRRVQEVRRRVSAQATRPAVVQEMRRLVQVQRPIVTAFRP
jgi:hypothetical protein